jgi:DNA-binding NarL/FixJ family response regulator
MAASAENAGADAFVTKSGDTSELLDAIRRLPPR